MAADDHEDAEKQDILMTRTLWLNIRITALASGLVCGLIIFTATNWLIVKGGHPVGPHLQLLSQFFWGYQVTFWGSIVGFFYGGMTGAICGGAAGWLYNRITLIRYKD